MKSWQASGRMEIKWLSYILAEIVFRKWKCQTQTCIQCCLLCCCTVCLSHSHTEVQMLLVVHEILLTCQHKMGTYTLNMSECSFVPWVKNGGKRRQEIHFTWSMYVDQDVAFATTIQKLKSPLSITFWCCFYQTQCKFQ